MLRKQQGEAGPAGVQAPAGGHVRGGQSIVLVDLENLEIEAQERLVLLDWELFRKECVRLGGPIKEGLVFIPPYQAVVGVRVYSEHGFYPVLCPKSHREPGAKDKDKVDYMLANLSRSLFGNDPEVAHIFIVSNDGDFGPLVTFFRNRGRQVTVFGFGKVSQALRNSVDKDNPVREFPTVPVPGIG